MLDFLEELGWHDGVVYSVDEDHGLVDAMDVVDARHLAVHFLQGLVAKKTPLE